MIYSSQTQTKLTLVSDQKTHPKNPKKCLFSLNNADLDASLSKVSIGFTYILAAKELYTVCIYTYKKSIIKFQIRWALCFLIFIFLITYYILLVLLTSLVIVFCLPFTRRLTFLQGNRSTLIYNEHFATFTLVRQCIPWYALSEVSPIKHSSIYFRVTMYWTAVHVTILLIYKLMSRHIF